MTKLAIIHDDRQHPGYRHLRPGWPAWTHAENGHLEDELAQVGDAGGAPGRAVAAEPGGHDAMESGCHSRPLPA